MPFLFGPVIAWLASSIGSLLSAALVWFAGNMAKRIAFFVAVVAAFMLISTTFVAAILSSLNAIAINSGGLPMAFVTLVTWVIDLGHFSAIFGTVLGVEGACLVAKWQLRLLDLKARI
jgi:hypothetical protein